MGKKIWIMLMDISIRTRQFRHLNSRQKTYQWGQVDLKVKKRVKNGIHVKTCKKTCQLTWHMNQIFQFKHWWALEQGKLITISLAIQIKHLK